MLRLQHRLGIEVCSMSTILAGHLISCLIAVPFLGIALLILARSDEWARRIALLCTTATLGLAITMWAGFDLVPRNFWHKTPLLRR